jgi:addiction module HigA family antidote
MLHRHQQEFAHPGIYIRENVLPRGLSVKAAAELLKVGRPALSNLLNGKAALSAEMAIRLQKAFGSDSRDLLERQAKFDQAQQNASSKDLAVGVYVLPFLKITARDIESWADGNIQARSELPVLLRKLVHSHGETMSRVDFPGYDNAQRKGWDGWVEAGAATPWVPIGKSGWEFGCDDRPKQKADADYTARLGAIPGAERRETNFVFVTPRNWEGKHDWARQKNTLREWKSVRAYDASDLEQWLERSIAAQAWMAGQLDHPEPGGHSLESHWHRWAEATEPPLSAELFSSAANAHRSALATWLKSSPTSPLIVTADSRDEALAFLYCLFTAIEEAANSYLDMVVVFSSPRTARKILSASTGPLISIIFSEDVERELGTIHDKHHAIIVRPRNTIAPMPNIIELDLLSDEAFSKGLEAMGIKDHLRIQQLARESGQSPTILRRRLSEIPAIRTPVWANDRDAVASLVPMVLIGAWHARSKADTELLSLLAGVSYAETEKQIANQLLRFDDPPVWSVGHYRGVASKIDSLYAIHSAIVQKDLEDFLVAAEMVLSEMDPALELPAGKRPFASLFGKSREFSRALREGVCETLVLLSVHGNELFGSRLGVDIGGGVARLVRRLMTPLSENKLLSCSVDLPLYAEAAPEEFLRIVEDDLRNPEPQIFSLMKPAENGVFGSCPRSGLLWALECLAWKPAQLVRVSRILARLAERKINDNWANKPEASLLAIYRCWLPQTSATVAERIKSLELLCNDFPEAAWTICLDQFAHRSTIGSYSQRPRWRNDASGAGNGVLRIEAHRFARRALDLALGWPNHDGNTLGDLVVGIQGLTEEDVYRVWDLIEAWAKISQDDHAKSTLRERIRTCAFIRRTKADAADEDMKARARQVSSLLESADPLVRHEWLFKSSWVEFSAEEIEEGTGDYEERDRRIAEERSAALRQIWNAHQLIGIQKLAKASTAPALVGHHLVDAIVPHLDAPHFIKQCLEAGESVAPLPIVNELVRGFLMTVARDKRSQLHEALLPTLPMKSAVRLLQCSPFCHDTWAYVDGQGESVQEEYWRDVNPGWVALNSPDINEMVDRLLAAKRPRTAFGAVSHRLEQVETSRLLRLLRDVASVQEEAMGYIQIDSHYIASALDILETRSGVSRDELAQLEFIFIDALDHSQHGIRNLERQLSQSPPLFVQVLSFVHKRRDGGKDPDEWQVKDPDKRAHVAAMGYKLLRNLRRTPGTQEDGTIDTGGLARWVRDVRELCRKHGRLQVGDQMIGQLLSRAPVGADGIRPCEQVRAVIETIDSSDVARGMTVGILSSRGAHSRAIDTGGQPERLLAEKYRGWSHQLMFECPTTARILEDVAASYDIETAEEDSNVSVRRRLFH